MSLFVHHVKKSVNGRLKTHTIMLRLIADGYKYKRRVEFLDEVVMIKGTGSRCSIADKRLTVATYVSRLNEDGYIRKHEGSLLITNEGMDYLEKLEKRNPAET